jgi:Uma2 family endonuclease
MSAVLETTQRTKRISPSAAEYERYYYPEAVDDEMGESTIHFKQTSLLFILLENFFASRKDVLVAANMTVYYDQTSRAKWYAPDVFVCFGTDKRERRSFTVWREESFPQVVFEVASDSTADVDLSKKYDDYNLLGVREYYLLDPEREFLPEPLISYHRTNDIDDLIQVKVENGRVFSPLLGLEIVDTGNLFRLYDNLKQEFLLTLDEAAQGLEFVENKLEQTEADLREAEIENQQLQAEIARLRELLKQK